MTEKRHSVQVDRVISKYGDFYQADCLPCKWHRMVRLGRAHVCLTEESARRRIYALTTEHQGSGVCPF